MGTQRLAAVAACYRETLPSARGTRSRGEHSPVSTSFAGR